MARAVRLLALTLVAFAALSLPVLAKAAQQPKTAKRAAAGVEIVSPTARGTVSGSVTWRVGTTAVAPTKLVFAIDGSGFRSLAKRPWSVQVPAAALGDGSHTLSVTAYVRNRVVGRDSTTVDVGGGNGGSGSGQVAGKQAGKAPANPATAPTLSTTPVTQPTSQAQTPAPAPSASTPPAAQTPLPGTKLYWGAWIGSQLTGTEAPWDMGAVSKLEQQVGKSLSLVNFSSPFASCSRTCSFYGFPTGAMENIRSHGAIPFFSWASAAMGGANGSEFQLADVVNGNYDNYIRGWAESAKAWGKPFFLRFNWEMNGGWFQWSEGVNGNGPGEYVAAWRHVHDIFTQVGASNATWTWCPNVDPDHQMQNLRNLYPGDEYVDWTCLDGYNWGTYPQRPDRWRSFSQLFGSTYSEITESIAPSKPMVIGEVGSSEYGGSKATWISEMLSQLPTQFPRIRGFLWFDKAEDADWPLESSQSSIAAFANGIKSDSYTGNSFASLSAAAIPPPS
jgi:mannan endo-1,4-beta-mannosidase